MTLQRSLGSLSNTQLVTQTRALLAARARNTAELLLHLAEIDERALYRPAAYPSLHAWCEGELGMSPDVALKWI